MSNLDEQIMVVDRQHLFEEEELTFQGLLTAPKMIRYIMKKFEKYFEVRRGDAEVNEKWIQPIPYAIIKRGEEVFLYKRLKGSTEERLHEQLSIGVGGHMNRFGGIRNWDDNLIINMHRELHEELNFDVPNDYEPEGTVLGLINDDSSEVSRVHIGILAILEIPSDVNVSVKETDKLEGYWVRIRDLKKSPLFEGLEGWSQIAAGIL
jgi:predicted NUDIX family phosphoesterase